MRGGRPLQKKPLRSNPIAESRFKFNLFASLVSGCRYLEHGQNQYHGNPDCSIGSVTTGTKASVERGGSRGSTIEGNVAIPPKAITEAVSGLFFSELPIYEKSFGFEDVGFQVSIFVAFNGPSRMMYQHPEKTTGRPLTKCWPPRWILTCQ